MDTINPEREGRAGQETGSALRCGPVEVRPARRELLIDGAPVAVERRAFDLIVCLMRHNGRVVDKDELWREVWNSRPVSDATLPQAVSRARRALGGDDPETYIANVYGVGYRFARPMEEIRAEPAPPTAARAPGDRRAAWLWATLIAALIVALLALWRPWQQEQPTGPPAAEPIRVAVLPVQNDTGNAELKWVSYGVLPLIDRALADAGVSRVSSGTMLATLRRYPEKTDPIDQARVLRLSSGADQVLAPRLTVSEGGFRLDLHVVDESEQPLALSLHGDDVSMLAVAAGTSLSESLARWQGAARAQRSLVTDDPFLNQAFARGLDARLRGRHEDAARYFDTVLAAAPGLHHAKYHLAIVTRLLGDWDYTDQLHRELIAAAEAEGDQSLLAAAQSVSGILAWRRGDKNKAQEWYQKSLANYRALGNRDYIASVTSNLGILEATRSDYATAEGVFLDALAHYERTGDRYNEATTRKNLGNLYVDQGRYDQAEVMLQQALALRQELELPRHVALILTVLADIEMARGHWPKALAYQERVLAAAQEHKDPVLESQARADLAACLRRLGRLEESRIMAARALTIATELDYPNKQASALLQQGRTEYDLGHWQRAAELLADAAAIFERIQEPLGRATSLIARAEALLQAEQPDAAAEAVEQAAAVVGSSQVEHLDSSLARVQAALAQKRGDAAAAAAQMERAYRLAREGEAPIETLDTGGRLGLMLMENEPGSERIDDLAGELAARAEASADTLAFLSRYHRASDPALALELAERRRRLIGEGWTARDEEDLLALRRALGSNPQSEEPGPQE